MKLPIANVVARATWLLPLPCNQIGEAAIQVCHSDWLTVLPQPRKMRFVPADAEDNRLGLGLRQTVSTRCDQQPIDGLCCESSEQAVKARFRQTAVKAPARVESNSGGLPKLLVDGNNGHTEQGVGKQASCKRVPALALGQVRHRDRRTNCTLCVNWRFPSAGSGGNMGRPTMKLTFLQLLVFDDWDDKGSFGSKMSATNSEDWEPRPAVVPIPLPSAVSAPPGLSQSGTLGEYSRGGPTGASLRGGIE